MAWEEFYAKVDYVMPNGFVSTAYLDEQDGDVVRGWNKHTNEPVVLRWVHSMREWQEIKDHG